MPNPQEFSFTFNDHDMLNEFGIYVERISDPIKPELRSRKVTIPFADGAVDQGARFYDERIIDMDCLSISNLTRDQMRELAYVLSVKGRIVHYREPDKYYIGRIYDPSVIKMIGRESARYPLTFICDPFAYGPQVTENFTNSASLEYAGTVRTPTYITITNPNNYALLGLQITMREEKI